jgi:hypothetical protein
LRYCPASCFLLACLLTYPGCDTHGYNSPDPDELDHHAHLAVMRFRTVNRASDTLGVVSVTAGSGYMLARRDAARQLSRSCATLGQLHVPTQLVYEDSEVHTCSTYVDHYVGYQSRYGGDTTHFGAMDRYETWTMEIVPAEVRAAFAARESASVYVSSFDEVPDTVRPNGILELDVLIDMKGLLSWQPSGSNYYLRPDHVHITQR